MLTRRILKALNPRHAGRADEQGSVVVVVVIIVTLSVSLVTLLATVQSNLRTSRGDQDRTAAFQRANGGIDHALYRFDRQDLPTVSTGSYVPVVVGGKITRFDETVSIDGGTYTVTAIAEQPGRTLRYRVTSVGVDPSGRRRQAVATLSATPLFTDGFFMDREFSTTGNQTRIPPAAYDSSTCVNALVSCEIARAGSVGTNGSISGVQGGIEELIAKFDGFNMYGAATQQSADSRCGTQGGQSCTSLGGSVRPFTDRRPIEVPPIPASAAACPNGGLITGSIAPGDYTCGDLTFQGTVAISGPGTVRIWPTSRFRASPGAVVNAQSVPARLQVYYDYPADPAANDSSICDAEIWGLLYAPGLDLACNGSKQPNIYGAVVANIYDGTGNQFKFHWDKDSVNTVHNGKYKVYDWRECPVGEVC